MKYDKIIPARFISRPNRFIAIVDAGSGLEQVHVKNTGRCKELLVPDCKVYLAESPNPERKTKYDLVAVEKKRPGLGTLLINMDSQIANDAAAEWLPKSGLFSRSAFYRREVFHGQSRFDFAVADGDKNAFLEVKGVTLEMDGVALFPDAPTLRGVKHIEELIECAKRGYESYILFVIQMKGVTSFQPNDEMHPQFGDALRRAAKSGVNIIAVDSIITPDGIEIDSRIPVIL